MGSLQCFKNVGFVQVMHYHKSSMGVWDIVTVCSYHELSVECVHPKITLKQLLRVMSQPYRPLSRMCIKASKRESICCVSCSIPLEFMNLKRSFYEYKKDVCKTKVVVTQTNE
jgi:hypothetical protein